MGECLKKLKKKIDEALLELNKSKVGQWAQDTADHSGEVALKVLHRVKKVIASLKGAAATKAKRSKVAEQAEASGAKKATKLNKRIRFTKTTKLAKATKPASTSNVSKAKRTGTTKKASKKKATA